MTTLTGTWNSSAAQAALATLGIEAHIDERDGSVNARGEDESVYARDGGNGTVQWSWLHAPKRHRSGVGGEQSLELMRADRARLEPRAEEVLGAFENATGLERAAPLTWWPQIGAS